MANHRVFRFLSFELDPYQRELLVEGEPASMPPKAFDVLSYLVSHRDRMVAKAELMDRFWTENMTEAAMLKTISQVRRVLGGVEGGASAIRTYHGRGFRFVAPTEAVALKSRTAVDADHGSVAFEERRLITILCISMLQGDEPGPDGEDGNAALSDLVAIARQGVERHEGSLIHVMVDGFTAAFGFDPVCEDGARRAIHCATELAKAAKGRTGFHLSFGLDSGPVSAKRFRDPEPWTLPDEIERGAARLADMAPRGEVVLSAAVREQLQDEAEVAEVPGAFRLVSLTGFRAGIPARPHRRPTRFVGRTAEMTFLAAQRDTLIAGTGQAVLLTGPPGIGKTRLVSEFFDTLDETLLSPLKVQCLPALSNSPMAPIRALCRSMSPQAMEGAIRDDLDRDLLRDLLDGKATHMPERHGLSDHQRRVRSQALFDRVLHGFGSEKPLVICVEDIHWLDATSREFLEFLLRDVDRKPLMMVLTTRPVEALPLTETVLHLSSLGSSESHSLLRDASGDTELPVDIVEALIERAHGNPFFIEELALATQAGRNPSTELPTTVQSVIEVRIGGLELGYRTLVYVIAVIGPLAPLPLVAHFLETTEEEVSDKVQDLVQMGFLETEPSGVAFRHMLINDTAYAMIEPSDRKRLHAEIAAYFEAEDGGGQATPERLAWHHQEAGATDRAIHFWIAASRDALHRSARQEAITFAKNGLALIDGATQDDARRELDLLLCLAPALTALQGFGSEAVGKAYSRADILNRQVGGTKSEIRVRVGLWIHTWVRGRLAESLGQADKLLAISARVPDPSLLLQAHASRGQVLLHTGELVQALDHLTAGLSAIDQAAPGTAPAQNAAVSCAAYASWVARMMGLHDEAERFLARSLHLAGLQENPFAEAIHRALGSESFMFAGDPQGCLAYADEAIALSREHDFAFWLGTGLAMRGWALGQLGEFRPAFEALDEGIAVFEATGARIQLANWHGLLAETHLAAGNLNEAHSSARHALACAERAGDVFFCPRCHIVVARVLERTGSNAAATEENDRAHRLVGKFGMGAHVLSVTDPL